MKISILLFFITLVIFSPLFVEAQKKTPKKTLNSSQKVVKKKKIEVKATQIDSIKPEPEFVPPPIEVDSTCPRCKGYKHDRFCDGLYCYQGLCATCKGYKKCVHCAGTMMKNTGLEGCPDCTDGKCRICHGSGLCAKCEGTGRLPCIRCGGTGRKTDKQIEAEIEKIRARREYENKLNID
ncbi:MAG: hypothetical protein SFU27_08925 [Thermonemataceae bacterium]|nr:hypothetical protein [Thermonemataceae bacterium]